MPDSINSFGVLNAPAVRIISRRARKVRLEIAVTLFDREQISIGVASRIAGLAISEMINELGRRRIPVVRYSKEDLAEELKYVRGLSGRR